MISVAVLGTLVAVILMVVTSSANSLRRADIAATQARIAQQLLGELQLNDWESLMDYDDTQYYFDSEGFRLSADSSDDFAFRAKLDLSHEEVFLPASETISYQPSEASGPVTRKATVYVTNQPVLDYDFENLSNHRVFTTWISKMEHH